MFDKLFNKAESAAQEIAKDAGLMLFVAILQFGAVLFVVGGIAWALSYVMAPPLALIVTGAMLGLVALIFLAVKKNDAEPVKIAPEPGTAPGPLASMAGTLGSISKNLDVVTAGMFAQQLKRAPVSTLAATAAIGVLIGMIADANNDDD